MSGDSKLIMLGLRGSGKTTFLAALWHYLESAEVDGRLSIPLLQPDRDYLNAVRNSWLALRPVGRTSMRANNEVSLTLFDKEIEKEIKIALPDLSGETFRLQWATRKAPKTYVEFARESTGALLFLHPNDVARTHVIKPVAVESDALEEDEGFAGVAPSLNWTPNQSSTQIQLVDVLQLLLQMRQLEKRMRLAIVISAWDIVKSKVPPSVWLEKRLPLLSQFIRANRDRVTSEVFGVSAQGGDLTFDRPSLLKASVPSLRSYAVQGDSSNRVPFAAPLQFLLETHETRS